MIFVVGGGSGGGTNVSNILDGATWDNGYIASGGGITSAGATTKERYTVDYSAAEPGNYAIILANNTGGFWVGVAAYKSDQSFISRLTPSSYSSYVQDAGSGLCIYAIGVTLPANTAFVRFSARTYGEGYAFMAPAADFASAIKSGTLGAPFADMWG